MDVRSFLARWCRVERRHCRHFHQSQCAGVSKRAFGIFLLVECPAQLVLELLGDAAARFGSSLAQRLPADGAFTAGVLMHKCKDGTYVIEHVMRGRWSALEREQRIRKVAEADRTFYPNVKIWIEQEPGSSGRESIEATIRNLAGFAVYADKVTGPKQVRAQPFAAQVQAGNVGLVAGTWVQAFLDECEMWPKGRFDDQVDAAAGAFNKLAASSYAGFQDVDWQGLRTNLYLQSGGTFRLW